MKRIYIFLALIFIALAAGLMLLPDSIDRKELKPEELLIEINDPARYLSTDQIAEVLINQDPSVQLVDVRFADQYDYYSIPGAVNIPFDEIMNEEWEDFLNQDIIDLVFFSNGEILADQAWFLCKRKNYSNIYVMKGGLNCWFNTIMQPSLPQATAPSEDFDQYEFRKGASIYFSGGSVIISDESQGAEPVIITRKKKKGAVEGGC